MTLIDIVMLIGLISIPLLLMGILWIKKSKDIRDCLAVIGMLSFSVGVIGIIIPNIILFAWINDAFDPSYYMSTWMKYILVITGIILFSALVIISISIWAMLIGETKERKRAAQKERSEQIVNEVKEFLENLRNEPL